LKILMGSFCVLVLGWIAGFYTQALWKGADPGSAVESALPNSPLVSSLPMNDGSLPVDPRASDPPVAASMKALEAENEALMAEVIRLGTEKRFTPRELLEALLSEPGEIVLNTDLFLRAQESDSAFVKALAMELKLYDHYSPADSERVAFGAVETMQLTPSGLVAARFLGQRISPELRVELEGAFSGRITEVSPAGNWLAAAALYESGDPSCMLRWSSAAESEIALADRPSAAILAYLTACSLWTPPESSPVLLAASRSRIAAVRRLSIPGLQRAAREDPAALEALRALSNDEESSVKEKAAIALRILPAQGQ